MISALLCAAASASQFSYTGVEVNYASGSAELPNDITDFFGIGGDLDIDAIQVEGRFQIAEGFYGYLNYDNANIGVSDVGIDFNNWAVTAGMGGNCALADSLDLYYGAGYRYSSWSIENKNLSRYSLADVDLEAYGLDGLGLEDYTLADLGLDDNDQVTGHIRLHAGLRWAPVSWLEVNPSIYYNIGVKDDDIIGAANSTQINLNLYLTSFEYVRPFVGSTFTIQSSDDALFGDLVLLKAGLRFDF